MVSVTHPRAHRSGAVMETTGAEGEEREQDSEAVAGTLTQAMGSMIRCPGGYRG